MLPSLYKITEDQLAIEAMLEETGGELTPELVQALAINESNFLAKSRNYGYAIMRMKAYISAIADEKRRLDAIKKYYETAIGHMETRLVDAMAQFGKPKVEMDTIRLSLRRSERVIIDNENDIPADCKVIKVEYSKTKIKEHLKAGETIGAHLEDNQSLQIK